MKKNEYGLLKPGGRWVLAPHFCHIEQYGRLVGGFSARISGLDTIAVLGLYNAKGHLLRELPGVRHCHRFPVSGLLYLTQQLPNHTWRTLLVTQAGQVRIILPGCHNVNELANTVALRQRRHLLRMLPEMDPYTNDDLPGSLPGGYFSTRGRRFWRE